MDKEHFDQLVKAVRQMNRHMAGKVVRGAKATDGDERLGNWAIGRLRGISCQIHTATLQAGCHKKVVAG